VTAWRLRELLQHEKDNRALRITNAELHAALAAVIVWQDGSPLVGGRGLPSGLAALVRAAIAKAEGRS